VTFCDTSDSSDRPPSNEGKNAVGAGVGNELFALALKVEELDTDAIAPQDVADWIREIAAKQPVVAEGRLAEMWCSSKDLQVRVRHADPWFDMTSWPEVGDRVRVTIEALTE
jgi:hypothetical protein